MKKSQTAKPINNTWSMALRIPKGYKKPLRQFMVNKNIRSMNAAIETIIFERLENEGLK